MSATKTSIRFFNDKEVRAVWDKADNKWWFCVIDICAILAESNNPSDLLACYEKPFKGARQSNRYKM